MTNAKGDKVPQSIQWDTEDRANLLSEKEGHIRENIMYVTSPLWTDMQEAFGGVVTHVKTSTDIATGDVTVAKALPGEPGAVPVRLVGALNTAEFSFFRPLRKLNLKVPANRQFIVTPTSDKVEGVGTVFVFPMADRRSVPRNRKEEEAAAPAAEKTAAAGQPEAKTE